MFSVSVSFLFILSFHDLSNSMVFDSLLSSQ